MGQSRSTRPWFLWLGGGMTQDSCWRCPYYYYYYYCYYYRYYYYYFYGDKPQNDEVVHD